MNIKTYIGTKKEHIFVLLLLEVALFAFTVGLALLNVKIALESVNIVGSAIMFTICLCVIIGIIK